MIACSPARNENPLRDELGIDAASIAHYRVRRRELVPRPTVEEPRGAAKPGESGSVSQTSDNADEWENEKKPKEWNPPLEECLASRRLGENDFLTGVGDKAIDRRLRTLDGYAKLSDRHGLWGVVMDSAK